MIKGYKLATAFNLGYWWQYKNVLNYIHNMKKIKFLKILVEISIIGLIVIGVFFIIKLSPWMLKFNEFSGNMPQRADFGKLRVLMMFLPILASLKVIIPLIFFTVILIVIRKVLISILSESIFSLKQVRLIKKVALIYLVFTGLIFFFNLIVVVSVALKNKPELALKYVSSTLGNSIGYVITSLIAYIIAEVFLVGTKLKQEAELTI